MRTDRKNNEIRQVKIYNNYLMSPQGSVMIELGNTKVICTATVENNTAKHLMGTGQGWITAEYSMLPGSTATRKRRDSTRGKIDGRSMEIQRLIGRSLRSVVDMKKLGEKTILIDCDVIQADGGTRTASITGAFVAMVEAMKWMKKNNIIEEIPVSGFVSAISVGIVNDEIILDLKYDEDSNAKVDMNVVMTDKGEYIEIQGTGEEAPFTSDDLAKLLEFGAKGCKDLYIEQEKITGKVF